MLQDKQKEIIHNQEIIEEAEFFWGWATPAGKLRAERRARIIIDAIKERKFSNILEIGSGTGIFTEFFCKAGFNINGIDISLEVLAKTKTRCSNNAPLHLSVADVGNLPFHDNSFDAVVGVCVLHHIDLVGALREIRRVVKKGGIILFSEPNMMNPQLMLQKNIKPIKRMRILGETEDETAFFRWQMRGTLKQLNFKEIAVTPFDFLHPWTPRPLISFVKKLGLCLERLPFLKEIAGSLLIYAVK